MVDNEDNDKPKGESNGDCTCQDQGYVMESEFPQLFSQSELSDLVQDLSLSKKSSELLVCSNNCSFLRNLSQYSFLKQNQEYFKANFAQCFLLGGQ